MKGNLHNPAWLRFVPVTSGGFTVNAGAAGWVDTDVSAETGVNTLNRVWVLSGTTANRSDQYLGARTPGSAISNSVNAPDATLLATVAANGHLEFVRNTATNAVYKLLGYLEVVG